MDRAIGPSGELTDWADAMVGVSAKDGIRISEIAIFITTSSPWNAIFV